MSDSPQGPGATTPRFPIAHVASKTSGVTRRELVTWPALVELLSSPKPGQKDGPGWIPGDHDPGPRSGESVRSWSVLALDIEAKTKGTSPKVVDGPEPPPFDEIMDELEGWGFRCVGHTTHSHLDPTIQPTDQAHHRYRLVFALSRPLAPGEIRPLGLHLSAVMGLSEQVDTGCLEPARLLYLPRCPRDRIALFQARAVEGEPLAVDQLLADAATVEKAVRGDRPRPPPASGVSVIDAFNAAHDLPALLFSYDYRPKARNRWIHPDSSSRMPGVRILPETGKVFSSHGCDPLNDGRPHDAFDVFKILGHGGDERAAVRAAAKLLGLSHPRRESPTDRPSCEAEAPRVTVGDGEYTFLLDEKSRVYGAFPSYSPAETFHMNDRHDRHHQHAPAPASLEAAVSVVEAAIKRCRDEPGALASGEFNGAMQLVRAHAPEQWFRLRVEIRKARPNGVRLEDIDRATRPPTEPVDDTSTADELVALVLEQAELFHSKDGACFSALRSTPRKVFHLETKNFAEWLGYAFYRATETDRGPGRAASDTSIRTARVVLTGIAKNDGPEREVYLRCAVLDDRYYIDLGDEDWRAVEVSSDGWRLVERPPVYFWRASTMRPLPVPIVGGDLTLLWKYCNVPEPDRPLVIAWSLESFRPETPFPILEIVGPQGAAKSTTQANLRRCLDPNAVDLRALPKSVEDLFVSAGANWMVSLNNLSHLTANTQDALCNLATGGGFAGRTLFTNADETLIEAKRPVVINGIVPVVTAQDLTDRVIHVELPEIATYRSETEMGDAFDQDAPQIIGGLLDLFAVTLREIPKVTITRPPRMADFAVLGEAMMRAQGLSAGIFVGLYQANRRESTARSLEASPVSVAIRAMVAAHEYPSLPVFDGNWERLLSRLDSHRESHGSTTWPKSSRGLSDVVRRQRPALAQIGIRIDIGGRTNQGTRITIHPPAVGAGSDGRDGRSCGNIPAGKDSPRSVAVEVEV